MLPILKRLTVLIALSTIAAASGTVGPAEEWRSYGGDPGGMRFSRLRQIDRRNVGALQPAWTYHIGETAEQMGNNPPALECTPLVVDGVLYLSTRSTQVIALDAETGKELWKFDGQAGRAKRRYQQHRGVSYWEGPRTGSKERDRRILFGTPEDGRLIALDATTGVPCPDFGSNGVVDLRRGAADRWLEEGTYGVTSPPAIYRDLVITGARVPESPGVGPSGVVRAFDVRTGKLVWQFHPVPRAGQPGSETWEGDSWKDRSGANVWSVMSVDTERGLVFLPVGSPAYDFYGGDRKGKNLFGNCVVALKADTGVMVWYFQTVHHDIWDYDLPAQPNLITVERNGRKIAAVAQVSKMGFVYVLDRLTGKPLFPIEERPVPASLIPGESAWPTQPYPVKPPALSRQSMTRAQISRVTPQFERFCTELFDTVITAPLFTPLGPELTLQIPGTLGGANWSGASFDPALGYLFVNTSEIPMIGLMKAQQPGSATPYRRSSPAGEYGRLWSAEKRWSCLEPPWGTLNAVDLNRGTIVWKIPLGVVDELEQQNVRGTGTPNLGGTLVTAGGLVFVGSSNDARFRAFDSRDGRELWVTALEASAHAAPITYRGKRSGRQFVAVAAGGGGYFSKKVGDAIVAFSLSSAK
ncbi:MAG: pyrroloquinoline quinone-dependent dehydrogenase [Acidobacteriota bacterium]